jgi:hypothetical protein
MKLTVKLTPIFVLVVLVFIGYTIFLLMNRPGPYGTNSLRHSLESMDNPPSCLGPVAEEGAPSCDSGGSETTTSVPGCYSTVRGDAYNGFISDFMSSDYILKTQMVTPVCPNNPVGEVGTEYGKEERIITPEDDKGVTKKDAAKTDYDPIIKPDNSKTSSFVDSLFGENPLGTAQTQGSAQNTTSNSGSTNTYLLNAPNPTANAATAAKAATKVEPSNGSCPPCPACQRCPEPVVECKRVVNYNAAGKSNLPVPMIADFSKF